MARKEEPQKRERRERGSINPEDIIAGAFELAEDVPVDNLSMPQLAKHLGVGVTSIYWYFRKKDELLNAMTDRALAQIQVEAVMGDSGSDWRERLYNHAHAARSAFLANPILCDLILIRSSLSPKSATLGAREIEHIIDDLVKGGLSLDDAFDAYSAVQLHVRGSVVLARLQERGKKYDPTSQAYYENLVITPEKTPLLAEAAGRGRVGGVPDDYNFEYGLNCILDYTSRLLEQEEPAAKSKAKKATARSSRAK
ncbi:TetR/AcrR family transcriptional regulator [Rhodococcus sp. NPDC060086]|uniref:TetR/AcrR family transcriptional regulator n=1 Tax=unclassified Rhodococcus (in: high G+C Gram-positive bacteria) TaxID=192944 RepID=UPI003668C0E1